MDIKAKFIFNIDGREFAVTGEVDLPEDVLHAIQNGLREDVQLTAKPIKVEKLLMQQITEMVSTSTDRIFGNPVMDGSKLRKILQAQGFLDAQIYAAKKKLQLGSFTDGRVYWWGFFDRPDSDGK